MSRIIRVYVVCSKCGAKIRPAGLKDTEDAVVCRFKSELCDSCARESGSDTYKTLTTPREGCCADWPKPCTYHEGWADALDTLTNHIHDLTGDGTGWWTCACGYRVSSNFEQRIAGLEAERDSARKRIQELMGFFREVHGRVYFDGHDYSEEHGLVQLNEAGKHIIYWGDD